VTVFQGISDPTLQKLESIARYAPFAIVALILTNFLIRILISPNVEWDEAEFVGYADFSLGYPNSHPPLLNWLIAICLRLTGNWVVALAIPKHIFLAVTYLLFFDIGRRLTARALPGAIAAASLMLVPEVIFHSEYTRAHAVIVMGAAAITLHAIVLLVERQTVLRFVWLALGLGGGLLAKYNFGLFVAAVAVAVALVPTVRRAVVAPGLLLTILIVAAAVAPHAAWALRHLDLTTARLAKLKRREAEVSWIDVPGIGLDGLLTIVTCVIALGGILVVIWWLARRLVRQAEARPAPQPETVAALARFFLLVPLTGLAMMAVFVLAADVHNVRIRYLTPFLLSFPLWLLLARPIDHVAIAARRYLLTAGVVAIAVTIGWPIAAMGLSTPFNFPYRNFAERIRPGIVAPTAIWSRDRDIYANLVIRIPQATVWDVREPAERVLIVYSGTRNDPDRLAAALDPLYRPAGEVGTATFPTFGLVRRPETLLWRIYERCRDCGAGAGESR
jgi:4-amino-4-deoxy-L-arabinose transferase-like glycosyltransferase